MKNLGPASLEALSSIGVSNIQELKKRGWKQVAFELSQIHPRFINLNMYRALIGACLDRDWRDIPDEDLNEARELINLINK